MTGNQAKALLGAALLSFILGSLHAFSVLLLEMERTFDVSRSAASITYSIALISLSAAVLLGHRLYARLTPPIYVVMTGAIAASGCVLAALSPSATFVWIGFGVIFGGANGLGYGYALQLSGRSLPDRKGFAMGLITAAYALGAVIFPLPLRLATDAGGWATVLLFLAIVLIVFTALSALTLKHSNMKFEADTCSSDSQLRVPRAQTIWLWLSYCGAVTAGLMVIGHASALAAARRGDDFWIIAVPIVIALANMAGSLLGGGLVDKMSGRVVLAGLAGLSSVTLLFLATAHSLIATVFGLAVIGFSYGGTIAAFPAYISGRFGALTGTLVYARVFTAWAAAGILGPYFAGVLFDHYHNYQLALILAAAAATGTLLLLITRIRN